MAGSEFNLRNENEPRKDVHTDLKLFYWELPTYIYVLKKTFRHFNPRCHIGKDNIIICSIFKLMD